jgi:hypothetical protein
MEAWRACPEGTAIRLNSVRTDPIEPGISRPYNDSNDCCRGLQPSKSRIGEVVSFTVRCSGVRATAVRISSNGLPTLVSIVTLTPRFEKD